MTLFPPGPVTETPPVYLRPETFAAVALMAALVSLVLFAVVKVIEHR